jgi:hypothetical protein
MIYVGIWKRCGTLEWQLSLRVAVCIVSGSISIFVSSFLAQVMFILKIIGAMIRLRFMYMFAIPVGGLLRVMKRVAVSGLTAGISRY